MTMVAVGVSVVGAGVGMYQANRQRSDAQKAQKKQNPFGPWRTKYAEMLEGFMDNPETFLQNPMYKAAFGQGEQAVVRNMSSGGYAGSGNMATGLQKYGMGFAWDAFKDQEKFLAELAGAQFAPNYYPALEAKANADTLMRDSIGQLGMAFGSMGGGGSMLSSIGGGAGSGKGMFGYGDG